MIDKLKRVFQKIRDKLERMRVQELERQRRQADIEDYWWGVRLMMEEEYKNGEN